MHEMSYVVRFVNKAIEECEARNAVGVRAISVSVGEMTDVLPEYLHRYYPQAVKGTILEGSELEVDMVPIEVECGGCGKHYHPERENKYLCPYCEDGNGRVISGREVVLERVEMVFDD